MAKTKISEFDVDPSNNTDINSINIAEGCAPSGINNAIRQLMSDLKEQQTGASGDNFTVGGNFAVTGTSVFTGATTFTGAVVFSSLPTGLGSIASQNANNVSITGGSITGVSLAEISSLTLEGTTADAYETTIASEPTADRTITLPDATTTLVGTDTTQTLTNKTINASQLIDASITPAKLSGAQSGSAPVYGIRAWANFDGTGSDSTNQTINASGNIASVYKNGSADYTVTFTTAMEDANYAVTWAAGSGTNSQSIQRTMNIYSQSSSAFSFNVSDATDNSKQNPPAGMFMVIR